MASARRASGEEDPKWRTIRAALRKLPPGAWTAYSDLGALVGVSEQTVGVYLSGSGDVPNADRVLTDQGEISSMFSSVGPRQRHSTRARLQAAGIDLDPDGRAAAPLRFGTSQLRDLLSGGQRDLFDSLPYHAATVADTSGGAVHAWVIRPMVRGVNLTPQWLEQGMCSLSVNAMVPVEQGTAFQQILAAVDQEYRYMPYAERKRKAEEIDLFVNRIAEGDLVVANLGNKIHLGTVTGPSAYRTHGEGGAALVRGVEWRTKDAALSFDDLPDAVPGLLGAQYDVIDLTEYADHLAALLPDAPLSAPPAPFELPDAPAALASHVHLPLAWLQECVELLRDRPQLILTGPPGTGKTFVAKALARALTAPTNVKIVQFHPAYAYEDFVEGYRPVPAADGSSQVGFELRSGPLRSLAERARQNPQEGYFLVIDEINRTDIAKVFGELYFLLEYRDEAIDLQYSSGNHVGFTLPKNLFILGTMNVTDRSLALVDLAIRRRFAFRELRPGRPPIEATLRSWLAAHGVDDEPARLLDALNDAIGDGELQIGHSYLMRRALYFAKDGQPLTREAVDRNLALLWETQFLPLLTEYHYGQNLEVAETYALAALLATVRATPRPDGTP